MEENITEYEKGRLAGIYEERNRIIGILANIEDKYRKKIVCEAIEDIMQEIEVD